MFYNAKNENIKFDGTDCDYISFGTGDKNLIMLPGVGDGFKTARGIAVPFAFVYSGFAKEFKVYVFSRRNNLPDEFSTADMADDIDKIMDMIGIKTASVFGVSQGGMISQQLAIRHPDKVKKLVLAVTASRPNELMKEALESWINMADNDDYAGIMLDTAKRSYTGKYLERGIRMNALLANEIGKTPTAYFAGKNSDKYTNPKSIKVSNNNVSVAVGSSVKVNATIKLEDKKRKELPKKHAVKFRYRSTKDSIATVDKKGNIKGIAPGTCTVYVYAKNGLAKEVNVTVN